jgi:hypothetical protein
MGRLIGGIVGSILGQIMCPIPFVGAMLGGLIGSMFGSMLDNLFASSAPCCCHNMGQQYGPMNGQMGYNYGYPMAQPYVPQGFHNPQYGTAPPLFPQYEPPVAHHRLPQVSVNPFYNHQHQRHHDHTTQRSQTAVAVLGKNTQVQENTHGHNQGRQVAVVATGLNEQRQENVTGNNQGTQVAVTQLGANRQTQTNVHGDNDGEQVAVAIAGANTQTQENVTGDNTGSQTAVTAVGVNTQTQTTQQGDNTGNQTAVAVVGVNEQTQESITGSNTGTQTASTLIGNQSQTQQTVVGDNTGNQAASTVVGTVTQDAQTHTGTNTGDQEASTVVGDISQTSHAGDTNTTTQAAATLTGDTQQVATGGDRSQIVQTASTTTGESVQAAAAGQGATVEQSVSSSGTAVQEASVASGVISQDGGNRQRAASTSGPVVVNQQGDRHGESVQQAQGSDSGDVIRQRAGQGTLSLFDDNSTASADLGGGSDSYTYQGNSEMNHVRVNGGGQHAGADRDTVRINTEGGSDTAVVNLSGGADNYRIDLGRGSDRLVINEQGQRIRVADQQGREIYRSEGWTSADGSARVEGMENLSVYREDGSFARWDRSNGLRQGQDPGRPDQMSPVRAARLFREHAGILDTANGTGSVDGIIGRSDLTSALNNPSTTPELREAIQYTLNNQSVWRAMDSSGAGGNRVNLSGLNTFIDGYENQSGYNASAPMTDRQAARVLNYHSSLLDTASGGGHNGKFNESDLRAITSSANSGLPPELRSAAQRLLGSSSFAGRLDAVSWESGGVFDSQRTFSNDDLAGFRG